MVFALFVVGIALLASLINFYPSIKLWYDNFDMTFDVVFTDHIELSHAEILGMAKELIQTDRYEFICVALDHCLPEHYQCQVNKDKVQNLIHWIHLQLRGHATLLIWLREEKQADVTKSIDPMSSDFYTKTHAKLKETRLNWLDWMIDQCIKEELEKKCLT